MFGRKKRNDDVETDEVIDEDFETTEEAPDDLDAKEAPEEDESSEEEDTSAYLSLIHISEPTRPY